MKKISVLVAALVLTLGLTQCKKEQTATPQNEGNSVMITLNVGPSTGSGTGGAKVNVDPPHVNFEDGDQILVVSNGQYVGTLTRTDGVFSGSITDPEEDQRLYFYFLGNKQGTLEANATSCIVNISDQTTTAGLPVISMGKSTVDYSSGVTSYTSRLYNKCSLMKFVVDTPSTEAICITGMKNTVTVDFSDPTDNGFTYGKEGEGVIKMPGVTSGNNATWAIVLPQEALDAGGEGSVYTADNAYTGSRPEMDPIDMNTYLSDGVALAVTTAAVSSHEYVDLGLPSGTLWATCNVGANAPEEYGDYFAWGETTSKDTYNWSNYQYCNGSNNTLTKYCDNSSYGYNGFTDNLTVLEPGDDAATANWGSGWRMPTQTEMQELIDKTTVTWTQQNGVSGRLFTAANGNSLFLPAAGYRYNGSLNSAGSDGCYWPSSLCASYPNYALDLYFDSYECYMNINGRSYGLSVRPVRSSGQK